MSYNKLKITPTRKSSSLKNTPIKPYESMINVANLKTSSPYCSQSSTSDCSPESRLERHGLVRLPEESKPARESQASSDCPLSGYEQPSSEVSKVHRPVGSIRLNLTASTGVLLAHSLLLLFDWATVE